MIRSENREKLPDIYGYPNIDQPPPMVGIQDSITLAGLADERACLALGILSTEGSVSTHLLHAIFSEACGVKKLKPSYSLRLKGLLDRHLVLTGLVRSEPTSTNGVSTYRLTDLGSESVGLAGNLLGCAARSFGMTLHDTLGHVDTSSDTINSRLSILHALGSIPAAQFMNSSGYIDTSLPDQPQRILLNHLVESGSLLCVPGERSGIDTYPIYRYVRPTIDSVASISPADIREALIKHLAEYASGYPDGIFCPADAILGSGMTQLKKSVDGHFPTVLIKNLHALARLGVLQVVRKSTIKKYRLTQPLRPKPIFNIVDAVQGHLEGDEQAEYVGNATMESIWDDFQTAENPRNTVLALLADSARRVTSRELQRVDRPSC